jgi:hypothetical protein
MREPPMSLPNFYSLPAGVEGRRLLPPRNSNRQQEVSSNSSSNNNNPVLAIRDSPSRSNASQSAKERPRSNLTALLNAEEQTNQRQPQSRIIGSFPQNESNAMTEASPAIASLTRRNTTHVHGHSYEADSASGPSHHIAQSAPTRVLLIPRPLYPMIRKAPPAPDDFLHRTSTLSASGHYAIVADPTRRTSNDQYNLRAIVGTSDHGSSRIEKTIMDEDNKDESVRRYVLNLR